MKGTTPTETYRLGIIERFEKAENELADDRGVSKGDLGEGPAAYLR